MAESNREDTAVASGNVLAEGTEGTLHRSKMSERYDEALAKNTVTPDGTAASPDGNNPQIAIANVSVAPSASLAPGQPSASPAENALSTQSEGKMGIGEELRDREFPIPPQRSGAASQRLVVDQETMSDEGPRMGGAVGTMPGDHQNVGEATDIIDQRAKTPDFPAQR